MKSRLCISPLLFSDKVDNSLLLYLIDETSQEAKAQEKINQYFLTFNISN